MSRPQALDAAEIERRLEALPEWALSEGRLTRTFTFGDFRAAFAFMTNVALLAEKRDHHPEWSNVYSRVEVAWRTHDADGITELDFELAAVCDSAAGVA